MDKHFHPNDYLFRKLDDRILKLERRVKELESLGRVVLTKLVEATKKMSAEERLHKDW